MVNVRRNLNWVWLALAMIVVASALIALSLPNAAFVIGGALALIALLRWHELGLYMLIFAVPYGSWFPISIGVGNFTAVDALVLVLIALWLARMIARERRIAMRFPPLSFPFAIFLFAALLSMTGALSLPHAIKETTKWLEMFALYLYVANNFDANKLPRVLAVMFLAGASQAAIGIYQFLFRAGPEGFLLFGSFIRAYGTFEQPNPFAGYLALIIPLALGVVTAGWLTENYELRITNYVSRLWFLTFSALALAAMSAALLMSWSRGAWIGVAAGALITIVAQSRRALILANVAALALIVIAFLGSLNLIPPVIAERFSGIGDYFGVFDVRGVKVDDANFAVVERMAHWQAAAEMFAEHPWLGVGFGNYEPVYPAYALPRWNDPLGHAHNYYLNIAAETGAIGLIAYLILWIAATWHAWRAIRQSSGMQRGIAAGLLGMIVALSLHNGFDNLFVHGMAAQVGIGLGMIAIMTNDK
ncbi:MAG: O-antigen ligase family protein [Chloroflexi bacterium]|nr:O-antigen ligase family protein [Chloroflexota bacterium]